MTYNENIAISQNIIALLNKKLSILYDILSITDKQNIILNSKHISMNDFETMAEYKKEYIDKTTNIDEEFYYIYKYIIDIWKNDIHIYKEYIKNIKSIILNITDVDEKIKEIENKNNILIKKYYKDKNNIEIKKDKTLALNTYKIYNKKKV